MNSRVLFEPDAGARAPNFLNPEFSKENDHADAAEDQYASAAGKRSGKERGVLQKTIQSTVEALKPEAASFYPEDGKRTSVMVFDMIGSWQLPATVEPLFVALDASVHVTPVMNGGDLQRGFKEAGM